MKTKTDEFDPISLLNQYKQKFNIKFEEYFQKKINDYRTVSKFSVNFIKVLSEFSLRGGKRLRPTLIYYSYKLFGGLDEEEILKTSIFIELIQSYLLIHDDIMDRALLRRGKTTVHKIYEDFSKENNFDDDYHFGYTMGILTGDLANQFSMDVIAESSFPEKKKQKLLKLVADEISKVIFGQCHDILLNYNYPQNYSNEDILKVHKYKTATYTFKTPVFAGAILSDAAENDFKLLEEYSFSCGIAFQIRDDIIGVFGKDKVTGKDTMSDLIEGKKTLLVTEAYKNGDANQKSILDSYIGKNDLTEKEAEEVKQIFKDTGALEFSINQCEKLVQEGISAISKLDNMNQEAYDFFIGIAKYLIVREY